MSNVQKTFALVLGIVLLIIGIWGLFTNSVLGFGVNVLQSVLHIIAGVFGLYVGTKGNGPGYNGTIGWIGVILGILGFIPSVGHASGDLLNTLLNINPATTWLHLVVGVISLIIYYSVKD
ncbi:DUF4383 domain-containing protein [Candidatus Pacearchaeota archaeon]|nr:DUF4383 domain-containing protein [Candidatus Pacearchaeota archaeon]